MKQKVSQYAWVVCDAGGNDYGDLSSTNVLSISKVFNTLAQAISGATPGLYSKLYTYNLLADRIQPNIVCYAIDEISTGSHEIDIQNLWTVDAECFIRIFTPTSLLTECNKRQRHLGVYGTGCYRISAHITINQSRVVIEGLQIFPGGFYNIALDVKADSFTAQYNLIYGNDSGAAKGILDTCTNNVVASSYYIGNTFYHIGVGIEFGGGGPPLATKTAYIYNNTIAHCTTYGIKLSSTTSLLNPVSNRYMAWLKNNLCQNECFHPAAIDFHVTVTPGP